MSFLLKEKQKPPWKNNGQKTSTGISQRKRIRIDKERNTYTSVIKLKPQQSGSNSTVGKDVDK